jgi:exopolysaccharide biosynthesis polyprenyl glycosylphosphotransferase
MLKQQSKVLQKISVYFDILVVFCSFLIAYQIRMRWGGLEDELRYMWILLIIIPLWNFLLTYFDFYTSVRTITWEQMVVAMTKVQIIGGVITSAAIYLVEPTGISRALVGVFLLVSFVLLAIEKIILKASLGYVRLMGYNFRNILVVGTEEESRRFIGIVEEHASWGLRILGLLQTRNEPAVEAIHGYKVFGGMESLLETCKMNPVDEVVFCLPVNYLINIDDQLKDLEDMGITVRMVLDLYDVRRAKRELSLFHGQVPILTFYYKTFDAGQLLLKRCLDIIGAVVGLAVVAILFPFMAVAIKLNSPGPLFFGQKRMGENGRIFKCWKFRSMYIDAEECKKELMHLNEMNGAIFKIKDDPRITMVGKFLRMTSLDELPQFWNVLKGEMSLVGTRPPTPDEVEKYETWHRRRISIKPGITGLWQVSGRNKIQDFDEIVHLDLNYIDNWSLYLDLRIMFQTLWVVVARHGSS